MVVLLYNRGRSSRCGWFVSEPSYEKSYIFATVIE